MFLVLLFTSFSVDMNDIFRSDDGVRFCMNPYCEVQWPLSSRAVCGWEKLCLRESFLCTLQLFLPTTTTTTTATNHVALDGAHRFEKWWNFHTKHCFPLNHLVVVCVHFPPSMVLSLSKMERGNHRFIIISGERTKFKRKTTPRKPLMTAAANQLRVCDIWNYSVQYRDTSISGRSSKSK